MGIDDVEPAPVPQPHVYLPRPILVITSDDQAAALARELSCEVERPLFADRLDDAVAERAAGQLFYLADDRVVIVHRDRLRRAHAARNLKRERPPRDRDHARTGIAREPRQDRAEEADADDRDRLPTRDLAAAENVHGATERLAGKRLARERIRKAHDRIRLG